MKSYFTEETVMKRLLSILLAVMMVLSLGLTTVYAEETSLDDVKLPFTDVKNSKWYADAIKYVYANELMTGRPNSIFAPEDYVTRAEFTKTLWSLAGEPETTPDLKFADTKNTKWYADKVTWAVNAGIVNGYNEGGKNLFKPEDKITRAEMAKMLVVFLEYMNLEIVGTNVPDSFTDAKSFNKWAVPYIDAVRQSGIMAGDNYGAFNPKANARRCECATILQRLHPEVTANADPEAVMEKLVDAFLEKALCGTHGQVELYGYFNSSITPENMVKAYAEAMELDTDVYALSVTEDSVAELKSAYEGCGNGTSAGGTLSFTLTHKESGATYDFDTKVYATKYIGGEEEGEVRGFAANPPFIPFACPDDYSSLKSEPIAKAAIDALKATANVYEFAKLSDIYGNEDARMNIWNAVNDAIKLDKNQFNLALKIDELDALIAQVPATGYKEITVDLTVIVRSTCKGQNAATDTVSMTFKFGYNDPNPGICDIVTDAKEVLPGSIKLDGILGETEYTYVDTYLDEIELRDKASGTATDALNAMLTSAKVGFAWDSVNGLHIAAQWQDTNRHQTAGKDTTGDNMLFSGTSLNLFVTDTNDSNGNTIVYYGIGKNTENGEYSGGSYANQAGVNDILLGSKAPVPNVDYIISYGDDNMVTVEWTIPADALAADGIKANDTLYLSLTMLGQNDSGFYAISYGNGGCFKESSAKKQMTVNLKGDDAATVAETERMQNVLDRFLASTDCVHGSYNVMFTYGGSLTSDALVQAISEAISDYATEIVKETNKMGYSTEYYVTYDGDLDACGFNALKGNFVCDWGAGTDNPIAFILHTTSSDVTIPFEIKVSANKHFSLLDYQCQSGDFNDYTDFNDAHTNKTEGYTDAFGVGTKPVYAPWYCSDCYNAISVQKLSQKVFDAAFADLTDDNGTIVVPVTDLAACLVQERTAYAAVWHVLNDLLDYDFPEYFFVLTAADVNPFIKNGCEGKLRIKLAPSSAWEPLGKSEWIEYNFKFVQKTPEEIAQDWLDNTLCGVHGQVEMFANFGSSWGTDENVINAVVADMGLNTATHTLSIKTRSNNYQNNGCGNHSGDSDDFTFTVTENASGASYDFDVHFSIMKYYNQIGNDDIVTSDDATIDCREFPVTVRHNCPDDQSDRVCTPVMFKIISSLLTKTDANGYLTVDLGGELKTNKLYNKLDEMITVPYVTDDYFMEYKLDSNLRDAATYGKGLLTVGIHHTSKIEYTFYVTIPVILK